MMSNDANGIGVCPVCKKGQVVKGKNNHHFCNAYKDGCKFYVGDIFGVVLTEDQVKELMAKKKLGMVKGFYSKTKEKNFDAGLVLTDEGRISLDFSGASGAKSGATSGAKKTPNEDFKCPKCGKALYVNDKVAKCGEEGHVLIFRTMSNKKITDEVLADILKDGRSKLIQGFKNRAGSEFNAFVVLDPEGKGTFEFEQKN